MTLATSLSLVSVVLALVAIILAIWFSRQSHSNLKDLRKQVGELKGITANLHPAIGRLEENADAVERLVGFAERMADRSLGLAESVTATSLSSHQTILSRDTEGGHQDNDYENPQDAVPNSR